MPVVTLFAWLLVIAILVIVVRMVMPESAQPIKNLIIWALVAVAVFILLDAFGVLDALRGIRTPRL
jgi:hypothetical protein